jgi:hypothetical protein
MKKLFASLAFMAALAIGASAHAAAVNIFLTQDAQGSASWTLSVQTSVAVGGISVLTTGLDAFNLNTSLVGLSAADSGFALIRLNRSEPGVHQQHRRRRCSGGAGATTFVIGT